jgi:hypothetical protein
MEEQEKRLTLQEYDDDDDIMDERLERQRHTRQA